MYKDIMRHLTSGLAFSIALLIWSCFAFYVYAYIYESLVFSIIISVCIIIGLLSTIKYIKYNRYCKKLISGLSEVQITRISKNEYDTLSPQQLLDKYPFETKKK